MKRFIFSVPSVTPVRAPSWTDQYCGSPSQPLRSRPLKSGIAGVLVRFRGARSGGFCRWLRSGCRDREEWKGEGGKSRKMYFMGRNTLIAEIPARRAGTLLKLRSGGAQPHLRRHLRMDAHESGRVREAKILQAEAASCAGRSSSGFRRYPGAGPSSSDSPGSGMKIVPEVSWSLCRRSAMRAPHRMGLTPGPCVARIRLRLHGPEGLAMHSLITILAFVDRDQLVALVFEPSLRSETRSKLPAPCSGESRRSIARAGRACRAGDRAWRTAGNRHRR